MQFEQSFVERIIQYDDLAFAQFYEQTADPFFRYITWYYNISVIDAHDLLSDIYVKIWTNLDKYDKKYTFWQFVRTILKNHCKDYLKVTKLFSFSDFELHHDNGTSTTLLDEILQEDKIMDITHTQFTYEIIEKTLQKLDRESQELIYSRYILQYSYEELSDLYEQTQDTIRQKISRIMKKMRQDLLNFYE